MKLNTILAVTFVLKMSAKEWGECALISLKEFFQGYGNIRKCGGGSSQERAKQKPEIFLPSVGNCGLAGFFRELCAHKFQAFSASCEEKEGQVTLRFMLCPDNEIEWDARPFEAMQKALGDACSMAGWRIRGYDNPFVQEGRNAEGMRAISLNGDQPNWLVMPDGQPISKSKGGIKKANECLTIKEDGDVAAVA